MRGHKKLLIPLLFFLFSNDSLVAKPDHRHRLWNQLLAEWVSEKGFVNYRGFKTSEKKLDLYLSKLSTDFPDSSWTRNEKLAYWINAYNAFTIKLILTHYGVKSIKDIKQSPYTSPWKIPFFKIGDVSFTLDKIEHEILRKEFGDPRIHFAIVCASYSCPQLRREAYVPKHLDQQLEEQTKLFINDPSKNEIGEKSIQLSSILKWYKSDFANQFANDATLVQWLRNYSSINISGEATLGYLPYRWELNGK